MHADGTRRLREHFYEKLGQDNLNLLWHLKEILDRLPFRRVLDVGAGVRISRSICLPDCVETASIVDPDAQTLVEELGDVRLRAMPEKIEDAHLEDATFDMAFFILSLLWVDDPAAALQKVASREPAYVVVAEPEFSPAQQRELASCFTEHASELDERLASFRARELDIDALMESLGYYPLAVYHSASWGPVPEHRLRTVFYTQEKPDRIPYDEAKLIIQVNSVCNCNCPVCYVAKTGDHMEAEVFVEVLEGVRADETICLRGGEPTLTENLIADFIQPSLRRGIRVILESNGAFIETPQYRDYLEVLGQTNTEIRLSLDRLHIESFPKMIRPRKIECLSRFIGDAGRLGIKFGLFSLGMSREQVEVFLGEYAVAAWQRYTKPLTKYSDITELPLRCKFVDVEGAVHDHITGIGWEGSPDEMNFRL